MASQRPPSSVKSLFKFLDHVSDSLTIHKSTIILCLKVVIICLKQMPSNFNAIFILWIKVNFEARLLSDVAGGLMLSSDNSFDFHAKIPLLPVVIVKNVKSGSNTK